MKVKTHPSIKGSWWNVRKHVHLKRRSYLFPPYSIVLLHIGYRDTGYRDNRLVITRIGTFPAQELVSWTNPYYVATISHRSIVPFPLSFLLFRPCPWHALEHVLRARETEKRRCNFAVISPARPRPPMYLPPFQGCTLPRKKYIGLSAVFLLYGTSKGRGWGWKLCNGVGSKAIEKLRFLASLPRAGAGRKKTQPFNWIHSRLFKASGEM